MSNSKIDVLIHCSVEQKNVGKLSFDEERAGTTVTLDGALFAELFVPVEHEYRIVGAHPRHGSYIKCPKCKAGDLSIVANVKRKQAKASKATPGLSREQARAVAAKAAEQANAIDCASKGIKVAEERRIDSKSSDVAMVPICAGVTSIEVL